MSTTLADVFSTFVYVIPAYGLNKSAIHSMNMLTLMCSAHLLHGLFTTKLLDKTVSIHYLQGVSDGEPHQPFA